MSSAYERRVLTAASEQLAGQCQNRLACKVGLSARDCQQAAMPCSQALSAYLACHARQHVQLLVGHASGQVIRDAHGSWRTAISPQCLCSAEHTRLVR